jgi:hypothetical protein
VASAFASEAAFFVTAERTVRIKLVVGVGLYDHRLQVAHELEDLAAFVCPDAGTQAIVRFFARSIASSERAKSQPLLVDLATPDRPASISIPPRVWMRACSTGIDGQFACHPVSIGGMMTLR